MLHNSTAVVFGDMHPSADTAASSADKACLGSGVVETEPWEQIFMPQLKRRLNRNRFSLPCLLLARTQMLYQHCGLYALLKLVSQAESIVLISSLWGKLTWSKSGYLRSRYSEASEQGFMSHVCPCSAWQGGLKSLENLRKVIAASRGRETEEKEPDWVKAK